MKYLIIISCIVAFSTASANTFTDTIGIGSKAPDLQTARWVKGNPELPFKKGKIYVVGFTGIGCLPCRLNIPVLSALSKKYSDNISFINIYLSNNAVNIDAYMKKYGDKMAYIVGLDDTAQHAFTNWMKSAGRLGIPTAFIVNQRGKIAWIGHPGHKRFEYILTEIIADRFDHRIIEKEDSVLMEAWQPVNAAYNGQGDAGEGLRVLDSLMAKNPSEFFWIVMKMKILLGFNESQAYAYAREILNTRFKEKGSDPGNIISGLCFEIINSKNTLKQPDWDLAIALAKRSCLTSDLEVKAWFLQLLAQTYSYKGDYKNAIITQQNAINHLQFALSGESSRKRFEEELALYKKNME